MHNCVPSTILYLHQQIKDTSIGPGLSFFHMAKFSEPFLMYVKYKFSRTIPGCTVRFRPGQEQYCIGSLDEATLCVFKIMALVAQCQLASGLENIDLAQEAGLCYFSTSVQHLWANFAAC